MTDALPGKRFTAREEPFVCEACGASVAPLVSGTYRDHCPVCLASKHVDIQPGDRAAGCGGLLEPLGVEGYPGAPKILYRCVACGHRTRNRAAPDDEPDALLVLASQPAALGQRDKRRRRR